MKLISIITINYNDCIGIDLTLKSIISRKTNDVEFIVIDGGSTDSSVDIIEQNAENIDYWISEADKGIYNAMNKGIAKAQGKYIMFVNSGDSLQSSVDFTKMKSYINDEDIIYHNLEIIEKDRSYVKTYPPVLDFKYFAEDSLPHTGTLIKRDLFDKYGFYNEKLKIVSDWAFFMDCILINKCSYKYVNECFASFFLGGISSLPQNRQLLQSEKNEHIKKIYPSIFSLYTEWLEKKDELYRLKFSKSVSYLKKLGFLKWLKY